MPTGAQIWAPGSISQKGVPQPLRLGSMGTVGKQRWPIQDVMSEQRFIMYITQSLWQPYWQVDPLAPTPAYGIYINGSVPNMNYDVTWLGVWQIWIILLLKWEYDISDSTTATRKRILIVQIVPYLMHLGHQGRFSHPRPGCPLGYRCHCLGWCQMSLADWLPKVWQMERRLWGETVSNGE